ncbi:MAG: exopolysaccharide biosynthesis protein [Rhodobacteraceae bacterium]|nr:exopolysaccharide biosynthesis protein [Paracoccaceae bacterium]
MSDPTTTPDSLHALLDAMRPREDDDRVYVRDIVKRVGDRSFVAVILIVAVIIVSPVSALPGTATLSAAVIALCAFQGFLGRDHLWLPGILNRRSLSAGRMNTALDWLKRPSDWMHRFCRVRIKVLSNGPMRRVAYGLTGVFALSWPLLEIMPFVTSFSAGAVSMLMFGLMTRDGIYIIWGYAQGGLIYAGILSFWSGLL